MVTIYCLQREAEVSAELFMRFSEVLPQRERAGIAEMKSVTARNDTFLGRLLLRAALFEQYGMLPSETYIERQTGGKPYLLDFPDIHFGISHTATCVVCAVSPIPVGIDAESRGNRRRYDRIITRLFSEKEREYVLDDISVSEDRLLEIWTMKESFVKLTGEGISGNFGRIDVFSVAERKEAVFKRFELCDATVSLCLPSEQDIYVRRLSMDELEAMYLNIQKEYRRG